MLHLCEVRLYSDQIGLIKECISQSPRCYRQSTKFLDLAELLRVAVVRAIFETNPGEKVQHMFPCAFPGDRGTQMPLAVLHCRGRCIVGWELLIRLFPWRCDLDHSRPIRRYLGWEKIRHASYSTTE
ncbi:uncharacterized protein LOC143650444 [Tamandua tetradactyla]|uniref:uncharacterized protein LOC143650444 n=1 Tax=Tamandua tetradactyla TaxID=48850 RepID=UPI004053C76E